MLIFHKGNVTIKIDGIVVSAASVIAIAGTKVLMSLVSMLMIHNPMTIAFWDKQQMKQAIFIQDKDGLLSKEHVKSYGEMEEKIKNISKYI